MKETKEVSKEAANVCEICHQEVNYPDFECTDQPGPHLLPAKTYYHPGGRDIRDLKDRRRFSPFIILKAAGESWVNGQQMCSTPQIAAQFHDGKFFTKDAELQYFLNRDLELKSGPEGETMWKGIYLTAEQRATAAQNELATLENKLRKMQENASLLDQAKAASK